MGERASVWMKSSTAEAQERIYLHWGGNHVGDWLMVAEANAKSTDPEICLTAFENAALAAGYKPERESNDQWCDGSNAGNFVVDVSQPDWKVEIESEFGYGLRGESKYHFKHKPFEIPEQPNGYPEADTRTDNHEYRHLFNAVAEGDVRMVRSLLEFGSDPNLQEIASDLRTPLHQCAYTDCAEIAVLLVEAGARLDIKDESGSTAKQIAQSAFGGRSVLEVIERREDYLEAEKRQAALGQIAQQTRPQDTELASPDEVRARRSRGRIM